MGLVIVSMLNDGWVVQGGLPWRMWMGTTARARQSCIGCVEVLHELCWPSQLAFEERASLMPGDS